MGQQVYQCDPSCCSRKVRSLLPEAKHLAVAAFAADDEDSFADGGSGGDRFARIVLPAFLAVGQTEFVQIAVVRADEDSVADDNRRAIDSGAGGEGPRLLARRAINRVDQLVSAADDHEFVGHCGGGVEEERGRLALRLGPR